MYLARRLLLVLVVLTALAGSAAYFATQMGLLNAPQRERNLGWFVFALMTALSVLLVVLIWRSLARSLRSIQIQLRHFEDQDEIGMVMVDDHDELADLAGALNRYLTYLKASLQADRVTQKELEIKARVAETERRQREAMIFSISEAVLVTDKFDELLMANPAAERLFNFHLAPCVQRPLQNAVKNDTLLELIRRVRQSKQLQARQLLETADPQTEKNLSLQVMLSCVPDADQDVMAVVVVIHDVTAEQELARMKDNFVSSVSHELKTPLASIRAYAELLADNEPSSERDRERFCGIIQEQADRLNRLIDNMLNLSRMESGSLQARKEPLHLIELINDVIITMEPQAREKSIRFYCECDARELVVFADRDMIYQAVMNIVANALKYSPDSTVVQVRLRPDDNADYAAVEVIDQGLGIPSECLGRIFDKFYRVDGAPGHASGTGLGLHLVKRIVQEEHQGRITVESQPGQGSTFTIYLPMNPLTTAQSPQQADHARPQPNTRFQKSATSDVSLLTSDP